MDDIRSELDSIGSGRADQITGKCESVRHALARMDSAKMTAGEAAAVLRKRGFKVTARELVAWWQDKRGKVEWHHAGQFGSHMGKTYFLPRDAVEKFNAEDYEELKKANEAMHYVFAVGFIKSGGRWVPVAKFAEKTGVITDKEEEISREDYELLCKYNGQPLRPYETFAQFKARMLESRAE